MSLFQPHLTNVSTPTRIAQILAITGVSIQAGVHIGTSLISVPSLLTDASPGLSKQWQAMYDRGLLLVAPIGIASTASFAYLAYSVSPHDAFLAKLYGAAAVSAIAFAPFTRLVMGANISTLQALSGEVQGTEQRREEVRALVQGWSDLNLVRGVVPLVALVLGTLSVSYHV